MLRKKIIQIFGLSEVPIPPLILGFCGLTPFIFLCFGVYFFSYEWKLISLYNLLNYSVIILSFIGAIHWGVAIHNKNTDFRSYLWSVLPAIIGWVVLIGFTTNYLLIIICLMLAFALTFYVDLLYTKKNIFPLWYLKLRKILSVVVFICLGLVAMAINNKII